VVVYKLFKSLSTLVKQKLMSDEKTTVNKYSECFVFVVICNR